MDYLSPGIPYCILFFLNPFCFTLSTGADSDTPWWCGAIRTNHKVYAIIWKLLVGKLNAIVSLAKVGPCCPPWICLNPRFVFVTDIFMFCARTRSSWLSTTFNKRNPNKQRLNAHFWIERICPAVTRKSQRLLFFILFFFIFRASSVVWSCSRLQYGSRSGPLKVFFCILHSKRNYPSGLVRQRTPTVLFTHSSSLSFPLLLLDVNCVTLCAFAHLSGASACVRVLCTCACESKRARSCVGGGGK